MSKWRNATLVLAFGAFLAVLATGAAASSHESGATNDVWSKLSAPLLQLLAVVIVVESALAALFQWRPWRMAFNARALKTPVMLGVGGLLVLVTGYNPMADILTAGGLALAGADLGQAILTGVLSAMIVAGGSSGINALFSRLGLRAVSVPDEEAAARELNKDQAWFSVRTIGTTIPETIQIGIEELDAADTTSDKYYYDRATWAPLAGTIDSRGVWEKARASFTADAQRFPSYGGRKVAAGRHYRILASWQSEDGPRTLGVFRGRFASRAVVDFSVDVSKDPS